MTKTKTIKATKRASKLLEELSGPMSQTEFNSLSKKQQREAIIALFFPNKCEVNLAKYVLKEREEKCGMIGGARRRRGSRRGRSTSSDASSTTSSSTNTPTQQQTAAQVAQAAATTGQQPPSQAAVEEATSGDIYDLLSIIMVGGGALAAGSLAIAAGLDEGLDALIVANGGTSLSHCTASSSVTSQLTGAFWGWQQPDMCSRAMDQMDSLIVAVPIAITALCHWFGIRNPITIMAGAARDSQRAIAERLRGCFTRPPSAPPSPALIHAAALAIDAQRARQTQGNQAAANVIQGAHSPPPQQNTSPVVQSRGRSRTSRVSNQPPVQPAQTISQAIGRSANRQPAISPSVSPVIETKTDTPTPVSATSATSDSSSEESSSEESSSPTPQSPTYSATTPPQQSPPQQSPPQQSPPQQSPPSVQPNTPSVGSRRRSARVRSRTPTIGGRKKTRKHKGKKKAKRKKQKKTRKHKNRKHKKKGRKTKKH